MRILSAIFFITYSLSLVGQVSYSTHRFEIPKARTVDPSEIKDEYHPQIRSLEAPSVGGSSYRSYLMRSKEKLALEHPIKEGNWDAGRSSVDAPEMVKSYVPIWNSPVHGPTMYRGGTPNDNTFGISNDGYFLTSWNARMYAHDINTDQAVFKPDPYNTSISFAQFASSQVTVHGQSFDPKILYDPDANRWVMLFLTYDPFQGKIKTSKTVMAFSTTSNPNDPWHIYDIPGNPLDNGTWSDYPAIALTKDELFFTINLLTGDDWINDFQRTVIWQIDKNSGYRGDTSLTTNLIDSVAYDGQFLRYFRPIQNGRGPAGPNMYFVSNRGIPVDWKDTLVHSSDSIWLIEVTNTIASGNASVEIRPGKANQRYHTPPDARQADNHTLFSNDARVLGGFLNNGQIQFVGTTRDTTTNRTAIYHGIIRNLNGPINVNLKTIGHKDLDIGYPNIAYTGIKSDAQNAVIGFDHSSPTHFAGNSCIYYDGNGNYSDVKILKAGEDYVDLLSLGGDRTYERWGDYFGIQRFFNDPKQVWTAGYYGKGNKEPYLSVSQLRAPSYPDDPDTTLGPPVGNDERLLSVSSVKISPNPMTDQFRVEFNMAYEAVISVSIISLNGQIQKDLIVDRVKGGRNEFSFITSSLPPGSYLVQGKSKNGIVFQEKLIKAQ